jgi:hypothetical protein
MDRREFLVNSAAALAAASSGKQQKGVPALSADREARLAHEPPKHPCRPRCVSHVGPLGVSAHWRSGLYPQFAELMIAPAMIRSLEFSVPRESAVGFGQVRLRVTWDNRSEPSINAPISLLFGGGTLYHRSSRDYRVKAFPVRIRFGLQRVYLACYFPMPFFRSVRFEIVNDAASRISGFEWDIHYAPFEDAPNQVAYFHATYRDHPNPVRVRIQFTLVNIPLFPGAPQQKQAWSEIRHSAYCIVMPSFSLPL